MKRRKPQPAKPAGPAKSPLPDEFPRDLRKLVEAELSAGNEIVEVSSTFPAPPAGAYVMLARPVTTREHEDRGGIACYRRNMPEYSWEWHDERRFWFVLEPPLPPEPEPDMDAIRAARNAAQGVPPPPPKPKRRKRNAADAAGAHSPGRATYGAESETVRLFRESMSIDYEKWHDGVGYDVDLLDKATPADRERIESILLERGAADWRDVEALAALDTDRTRDALRAAMQSGGHEIRLAVQRHAPHLVPDDDRTASLVRALEGAGLYGGLSQAIDDAEEFHPPEVLDALFRGALRRDGEAAVHFAALLEYLHGKSAEPFDWSRRPFYLKFHTTDRREREALFRELCERCGVDAAKWLPRRTRER